MPSDYIKRYHIAIIHVCIPLQTYHNGKDDIFKGRIEKNKLPKK